MSDANKIFFCLDEAWTEESLEELVAFLQREYTVTLPPGFEFVETVRSESEITRPSHYVDELTDGFGSLSIEVGDGIGCALQHDVPSEEDTAALDHPNILISVPQSHLRADTDEDDSAAAERIDGLYDFFVDLYAFLRDAERKPRYVYGLTAEDERRIATPEYAVTLSRDRIENDELPGAYWFQIVPPRSSNLSAKRPCCRLPRTGSNGSPTGVSCWCSASIREEKPANRRSCRTSAFPL